MIRDPKIWRVEARLSQGEVATRCGIIGRNPSQTYSRYERGIQQCPAEIIEKVAEISAGAVTAESWQRVRIAFLREPEHAVAG